MWICYSDQRSPTFIGRPPLASPRHQHVRSVLLPVHRSTFLHVCRWSTSQKGRNLPNVCNSSRTKKHVTNISNVLRELMLIFRLILLVTSLTHDIYTKLIISSLDFSVDGHSRAVFMKAISSPSNVTTGNELFSIRGRKSFVDILAELSAVLRASDACINARWCSTVPPLGSGTAVQAPARLRQHCAARNTFSAHRSVWKRG